MTIDALLDELGITPGRWSVGANSLNVHSPDRLVCEAYLAPVDVCEFQRKGRKEALIAEANLKVLAQSREMLKALIQMMGVLDAMRELPIQTEK